MRTRSIILIGALILSALALLVWFLPRKECGPDSPGITVGGALLSGCAQKRGAP